MTSRRLVWLCAVGLAAVLLGCSRNDPPPQAPPGPGGQGDAGGGPPAKQLFAAKGCAKCHNLTPGAPPEGEPKGGGPFGKGKGRKGPDLGGVGRDPAHTVQWLTAYIRNPKSQKPDSKMPPQKHLSEDDLRTLAEYLASLK